MIGKYRDNEQVVEVALPVVCKGMRILCASKEKMCDRKSLLGVLKEVKSIHSGDVVIYRNCGILEMLARGSQKTAEDDLSTRKCTRNHSSRSETGSESSSRKSRVRAAKEHTVPRPKSGTVVKHLLITVLSKLLQADDLKRHLTCEFEFIYFKVLS